MGGGHGTGLLPLIFFLGVGVSGNSGFGSWFWFSIGLAPELFQDLPDGVRTYHDRHTYKEDSIVLGTR